MPDRPATPTEVATDLAGVILIPLRQRLESLVLGTERVTDRHLAAFSATFEAADELVSSAARIGGASSPDRRASEVLSRSITEDRSAAQHALRLLHAIHGPQAAEPSKVCGSAVTVWDLDRCIRPEGHSEPHLTVREDGLALSRDINAEPLTEPAPPRPALPTGGSCGA